MRYINFLLFIFFLMNLSSCIDKKYYVVEKIANSAAFSRRDTGEDIVFNGKMWLSNGYFHNDIHISDLWSSTDGEKWVLVNDKTPYDVYSEMVVYKNEMWAVKGSVWKSKDGVNWIKVLDKTPFGQRSYGETIVFNDKIYQLGHGSDVWSTADGKTWDLVIDNAPYGDRKNSFVTVYNGKLWLMGGYKKEPNNPPEAGYKNFTSFNDVWVSSNGVKWELVNKNATWSPRQWSILKVFDNKMWLVGGYSNKTAKNLNDTWYSVDGLVWNKLDVDKKEVFSPRHEATVFVYQNDMFIVAGNAFPVLNDSWKIKKSFFPWF